MLIVSGAYGRDYKSGKAAKADFDANKDFMVQNLEEFGRMVNKEQLTAGTKVQIRYKAMRSLVVVTV